MDKFYRSKVYYPLMSRSMGDKETGELRRRLLAQAAGEILEIGFGSGINLKYYPKSVQSVTAIDTSRLGFTGPVVGPAVQFEIMSVEALRFQDSIFDTVVSAFTLCSVSNLNQTLSEIQRVLKPDGRFLFLEHGKSWFKFLDLIQNLANPFYQVFACGCHVNRDIPFELTKNGFHIDSIQKIYVKLAPISGYYYLGTAIKAPKE